MLDVMVTFFFSMHSPIAGRKAEENKWKKKDWIIFLTMIVTWSSRVKDKKIHFSFLWAGERAEMHLAFSNEIHKIVVKAFFTY